MTIDDAGKYFNAPEDTNLQTRTSELIFTSRETVIVLDDDPTGTQTVHDVPVLTDWKVESLQAELSAAQDLIYVLTNTRRMSGEDARKTNREIGEHISMASKLTGRDVRVISRSDSTLRGHYPLEIEELQQSLNLEKALQVVIPAFMEGGRYTLDDVHYVQEGKALVPAGETPYAADEVFGYRSSHVVDWIEEKYLNRIVRDQIKTIPIPIIRDLYARQLAQWILNLEARVVIVNAASYYDLEKVALALRIAEQEGRDFIYRTAASFVRAYCAKSERAMLEGPEVRNGPNGGLILVESSHKQSQNQLQALLSFTEVQPVALSASAIKEGQLSAAEVAGEISGHVQKGADVAVYFEAAEDLSVDHEQSLWHDFLVEVLDHTDTRPGFLLAKGDRITSEIATRVLKVRRAMVRGQISEGIPVWELGYETPFPGLRYILFPDNVGEEDTLLQIALKLRPGA